MFQLYFSSHNIGKGPQPTKPFFAFIGFY